VRLLEEGLFCAGIDVSRILTPAATLRPDAAQTCQTKQDHGLETGLDLPELIGACASALPDDGAPPQPVYHETSVCNVRVFQPLTLTWHVCNVRMIWPWTPTRRAQIPRSAVPLHISAQRSTAGV